jgi:hypothetical protein
MRLPDFSHTSIVLFFLIAAVSIGLALWKGGQPERLAAGIFILASFLQTTLYQFAEPRLLEVDLVGVLADLVLTSGIVAIALNAKRAWTIWASALQLLTLSSHFPRSLDSEIMARAYAILSSAPTGVMLVLLIIGTIGHQRRLMKNGSDADWVDWKLASDLRSQRAA